MTVQRKSGARKIFFVVFMAAVIGAIWLFWPRKGAAPSDGRRGLIPSGSVPTASADLASLSWSMGQTVDVPILMYHHIGDLPADADDIRRGLTVSADEFKEQLKFLKDNEYNVVTLGEMYRLVAEGPSAGEVPEKIIVLTFDDGYLDNYEVAWPLLQRYGFRGTFFIISGKIGQDEYMSGDQIKELAKAGNEIGSHSAHHLNMAELGGQRLKDEAENPRIVLEELTGQKVVSFCYPAGKFTPKTAEAVGEAGYKVAVTTQKGAPFSTDNPYEVPRYRVNPGTSLNSLLKH